jgi:hypothetical protein
MMEFEVVWVDKVKELIGSRFFVLLVAFMPCCLVAFFVALLPFSLPRCLFRCRDGLKLAAYSLQLYL